MNRPIITLLTDFGNSDHYVAAIKGVILSICADAQLVDVTHEVSPFQIAQGAFLLSQAWNCFPTGTIHLVVVDPGVGSRRRPLLVEAAGYFFIAPDNGVLTLTLQGIRGPVARELTAEQFFRRPFSNTFHGRDIFAPVAAHLAAGVPTEAVGEIVSDLVFLPSVRPVEVAPGEWQGMVLHTDHFGNIVTNFDCERFPLDSTRQFELIAGNARVSRSYPNYNAAVANELFVICGSSGYLEISVKEADAARRLNILPGDILQIHLF